MYAPEIILSLREIVPGSSPLLGSGPGSGLGCGLGSGLGCSLGSGLGMRLCQYNDQVAPAPQSLVTKYKILESHVQLRFD